jgi:hypothetical protein
VVNGGDRVQISNPLFALYFEQDHPRKFGVGILGGLVVVLFAGGILAVAAGGNRLSPRYEEFPDADGALANLNLGGPTDTTTNPFFQPMGCRSPNRCAGIKMISFYVT